MPKLKQIFLAFLAATLLAIPLSAVMFQQKAYAAEERFKFRDNNGKVIEYHSDAPYDSPEEVYTYEDGTEQPYIYKIKSAADTNNDDYVGWSLHVFYNESGTHSSSAMTGVPMYDGDAKEIRRVTVQGTSTFYSAFPNAPSNLQASRDNRQSFEAQEASTEEDENCENSGDMGWILCPVIRTIDSALNWVDTQIQRLLLIDRDKYVSPEIESAWKIVRNIAFVILVPITLVMIIGTALGFDFISAYTVKRALPRLIAATIFITFSYAFCVFLIDLFNAIGLGVLGILTYPFGSDVSGLSLSSLFSGGEGNIVGAVFKGAGFAIGTVLVFWLFGGTLLLFAAMAFLVLLIRQMFIVALVLLAPLAILAWIFPGNDKLWKIWWGSFSKLLMMFPLIMGVIAVGRIFAFVIHSDRGGAIEGVILTPLMTLAAYMIPYAFIPFTFKFAGGMFATIAGVANDRSKGIFDRQKKSRAAKLERTAHGNMFKGAAQGTLRGRLNTLGAGTMNVHKAGLRPSLWRSGISTAIGGNAMHEVEKNLKENGDYQSWANNDTLNMAAAATNNAKELRAYLTKLRTDGKYNGSDAEMNEDIARIERVRKQMSAPAFRQMTTLQALAGGTAYDTAGEAWSAVAMAAGNDTAAAQSLIAKGRSALMSAGRIDQGGAGFGDTLATVDTLRDKLRRNGTISITDMADADKKIHEGVLKSQGGGTLMHASMKPKAIKNLAPFIAQGIQTTIADMDNALKSPSKTVQRFDEDGNVVATLSIPELQRELDQNLASLAGVYDAMAQNSPQNAKVMADTVMSDVITDPGSGKQATIQSLIEARRGSPEFTQMRREYQDRTSQIAAQRQSGQPGPPTGPATGGPPTNPTPPII